MVDRLAEDHANARALAEGLAKLPGLDIDLASVQTNIVIFQVKRGNRRRPRPPRRAGRRVRRPQGEDPRDRAGSIRCVTHKDIDAEDIGRTLDAFAEITRKP
jgi:threonine aldolase